MESACSRPTWDAGIGIPSRSSTWCSFSIAALLRRSRSPRGLNLRPCHTSSTRREAAAVQRACQTSSRRRMNRRRRNGPWPVDCGFAQMVERREGRRRSSGTRAGDERERRRGGGGATRDLRDHVVCSATRCLTSESSANCAVGVLGGVRAARRSNLREM